jgi:hypothetical protein
MAARNGFVLIELTLAKRAFMVTARAAFLSGGLRPDFLQPAGTA